MRVHSVWLLSVLFVGSVIGALGCGDDGGGDDETSAPQAGSGGTPCVAGTAYDCVGPIGCSGRRLCRNGFLTPCMCSDDPPPMSMQDASTSADGGRARDGGRPNRPDAQTGGRDAARPGEEDCDNGRDDDGDGDPDCADSDCDTRSCVEEAPQGWEGPVLLREGDAPADCGGSYPDEVLHGGTAVQAAPATCSACSCSGATSGCATFLNFGTGSSTDCGGVTCSASVSAACAELSSPCLDGLTTGYLETQLPGVAATCTPSAQAPKLPAADWTTAVVACAPARELARAGCDRDELCAPNGTNDGMLCVHREGDHPCPAGAYRERHLYFTGWDDTRDCSDCSCAHDCSYAWRTYAAGDTACATPLLTLTNADQCAAVTPVDGKIRVGVQIAGSGQCQPSGGTAQGGVTATGTVTACCMED